ncbi:hypothetical protein B0H16DRAFT_1693952 [Mycena metata]|uniref:Uncharacterized protein n=1 Tax=Mycena metata TaxID=1033252 RepID=A0AAD7N0X6_9AGAR|nr:hypothetical protein B0H16DRAFT_1693952 [Mycena metata]
MYFYDLSATGLDPGGNSQFFATNQRNFIQFNYIAPIAEDILVTVSSPMPYGLGIPRAGGGRYYILVFGGRLYSVRRSGTLHRKKSNQSWRVDLRRNAKRKEGVHTLLYLVAKNVERLKVERTPNLTSRTRTSGTKSNRSITINSRMPKFVLKHEDEKQTPNLPHSIIGMKTFTMRLISEAIPIQTYSSMWCGFGRGTRPRIAMIVHSDTLFEAGDLECEARRDRGRTSRLPNRWEKRLVQSAQPRKKKCGRFPGDMGRHNTGTTKRRRPSAFRECVGIVRTLPRDPHRRRFFFPSRLTSTNQCPSPRAVWTTDLLLCDLPSLAHFPGLDSIKVVHVVHRTRFAQRFVHLLFYCMHGAGRYLYDILFVHADIQGYLGLERTDKPLRLLPRNGLQLSVFTLALVLRVDMCLNAASQSPPSKPSVFPTPKCCIYRSP